MPNNLPEADRSVLYVLQLSQSTHPYHALLLSYHVSGAQQDWSFSFAEKKKQNKTKLAFDLLDVNESKFEGIEICI